MGVPAEVSLYVIVHVCDASVHGFGVVNEPVPDEVLNVTVPVGLEPVTVAVQVVVPPTVNDGHETTVPDEAKNCRITLPTPVANVDVLMLDGVLTTAPPEVAQSEKVYPDGGAPRME